MISEYSGLSNRRAVLNDMMSRKKRRKLQSVEERGLVFTWSEGKSLGRLYMNTSLANETRQSLSGERSVAIGREDQNLRLKG